MKIKRRKVVKGKKKDRKSFDTSSELNEITPPCDVEIKPINKKDLEKTEIVSSKLRFTLPELTAKIEEFYEYIERTRRPLTMGRLAWFLDTNVQTINSLGVNDGFYELINHVRMDIMAEKEELLCTEKTNTKGIIYYLEHNHNYRTFSSIPQEGTKDAEEMSMSIQKFISAAQVMCMPDPETTHDDIKEALNRAVEAEENVV